MTYLIPVAIIAIVFVLLLMYLEEIVFALVYLAIGIGVYFLLSALLHLPPPWSALIALVITGSSAYKYHKSHKVGE